MEGLRRTKIYYLLAGLALSIVAGIWLFDFFINDDYGKPVYDYSEFCLYVVLPVIFGVFWFLIRRFGRKSITDARVDRQKFIEEFKKNQGRYWLILVLVK